MGGGEIMRNLLLVILAILLFPLWLILTIAKHYQ